MELKDIRAELNFKMLELERAIDVGMPYTMLKKIYTEIKELQYQCVMADFENRRARSESADMVIE